MSESLKKPTYFDDIRTKTDARWRQLEDDRELAGPWHQLFKQVQSPRHILSELLQNADDANASEAKVYIENEAFIFEHNGDDFEADHFASLCRFGYSNKRALHTIGFRGIGFKSTFSLGDTVELRSPTLAVRFEKSRFTQPHWIDETKAISHWTRVSVPISNDRLRAEAEKNLDEWVKSPVSLLFFRNIRELRIRDHAIRWDSLGDGPVPNSEWMALNDTTDNPYLHTRSSAEEFPEDALEEIRGERLLSDDEDLTFPPSRVEIVVGAEGRLYVVLPTGVSTRLPFAVNAPFIQDPARMKIKDPETSPTNRWLLDRVGKLAATTMHIWLSNQDIGLEERSKAYDLLPDVNRKDNSLEGSSATTVELAFEAGVEDKKVLLTEVGELVDAKMAIHLPAELSNIWPVSAPSQLLDEQKRPAFSYGVSELNVRKLVNWQWLEQLTNDDFLEALTHNHLPKPADWSKLFALWTYIAPDMTGYGVDDPASIRIFPVKGANVLYAANEVVRLSERKLSFNSDEDWQFLSNHLLLMDSKWIEFLERRQNDFISPDSEDDEEFESVFDILSEVGLKSASDASAIVDRVARSYFGAPGVKLSDCIRLSQIAAKFGAILNDDFRFVTRDRNIHKAGSGRVILDIDSRLEDFIPEGEVETRLLHQDYTAHFSSCSAEEWQEWVGNDRTKLLTCFPFRNVSLKVYGRTKLENEALRRGHQSGVQYHYKSDSFRIEDWDFPKEYWDHWRSLEAELPDIWKAIARRIFEQPESYWRPKLVARVYHLATNGSERSVVPQGVTSNWVSLLAELPCLPDVQDNPSTPASLLLRTPETEPLLDIEPFVHRSFDNDTTRLLLIRLGVGTAPTGPGRLLERLRALSTVTKPPVGELERWYRRLDQLVGTSSTDEMTEISLAFKSEALILGHDGSWNKTAGVAIALSDDDFPGAISIIPSVAHLSLWRKIGVTERPTFELALEWLSSLPEEKPLGAQDQTRVRSLLGRYPLRIIEDSGKWLSLSGHWLPFPKFRYAVSMQTLARWKHLHDWVKVETANFQMLTSEWLAQPPFSGLLPLSSAIDEKLTEKIEVNPANSISPKWLNSFGKLLRRVELNTDDETIRISSLGRRMELTVQCQSNKLEIVPYVNGVPAGIARRAEILWIENTLFISTTNKAKAAKIVPEEITISLNEELKTAAAYAYERKDTDIEDYMTENFKLRSNSHVQEQLPHDEPTENDEIENDMAGSAQVDNVEALQDIISPAVEVGDRVIGNKAENADATESNGAKDGAEPNAANEPVIVKPRASTVEKRSVLESFAEAQGFKKDANNRYFHSDGRWLARTHGMTFPWALHTPDGEVERFYYDRQHCLEHDPLEIVAEIWGLVDNHPSVYSFILSSPDGAPIELTGIRLREMKDSSEMSIHPASYRLVYGDEN